MAFPSLDQLPSSSINLYILLPFLALTYLTVTTFLSWYRLRHIPGPFLASLSYLWIARIAAGGRQFWVYRDMPRQYQNAPLIRVGPNELSTDDPEVIRRINGVRSNYARDPWYLAARFDPYHDNVFTILGADAHDRFKAKIAGAYGGRETPALEPGIDDQVSSVWHSVTPLPLFFDSYWVNKCTRYATNSDIDVRFASC